MSSRTPFRIGLALALWLKPDGTSSHTSIPSPITGGEVRLIVTPIGDGQYIYTTLSLFRQLPAGVPGGARLFVNLLSAGLAPSINP